MDNSHPTEDSKVLIIYTGGTIGMLSGPQGYVPEPYFLTETLRSQTRFNDPHQASLFSHASSVQGFRDWNNSGRSSPTYEIPSPKGSPERQGGTLPVRSSRPIGLANALVPGTQPSVIPQPECTKVEENVYEARLPALVTPRSSADGTRGKCIRYAVLEASLHSLSTFKMRLCIMNLVESLVGQQ
jgi:lysophospholipase